MSDLKEALSELSSDDKIIRHNAVTKLGEIGGPAAIKQLTDLLRDESPTIKDEAVNSLIAIGGEDVATAVVPLLYDDEVYVSNISVEILARLGEVSLNKVVPLLNEEDDDVLKFALDVIAMIGNQEPVAEIIPILKHKNPNSRSAAAVALGKMKATAAIDNLVVLLSDDDEWVRFSTLEAIGSIGGAEVADKLLDVFKAVDISRIAALDALSMLAEPEDADKVMLVVSAPGVANVLSIETIVRFIEKFDGSLSDADRGVFIHILLPRLAADASVDEQRDILRGLALLKDIQSLDALLLFAGTKDYDEDTRAFLKYAIVDSADIDKLTVALSKYPDHSLAIVEALGEIKDPQTVESLIALLNGGPDKKVDRAIIEALGNIGTPNTYDTLVSAVNNEESNIRKNAIVALGKLGNDDAISVLLERLLIEEYDDIKAVIGSTLTAFDGEGVEKSFVSLLANEDEAIRAVGVEGLGGLRTESAKKVLLETLADDAAGVKCEVLRALGGFEGDDIITILSGALSDKEKPVRMAVIDILNEKGNVGAIVNALNDEDLWVRFKVANIMGEKAVAESEDALVELLINDEIPVKVASARALGNLASKKAIEPLKALTEHEDSNLSSAAKEALAQCEA